jgi:gluconokinase
MILILMGISGSGKTTIGKALAARLSIPFLDGDDFHSAAAITKMQNGSPLTDADRLPWLNRLNEEALNAWSRSDSVVIACSALKKQYRETLSCGLPDFEVTFITVVNDLPPDEVVEHLLSLL